ncbi:MAG TPA: PilZ domain-containing protein [Xanthobacteraceae bacterium]|jgi:hypothetical protein|nr:PilZ domain-containing protein [Xanthobacteraceae bacterium]
MVVVGNFRNRAELRRKPRRAFHHTARIVVGDSLVACSVADISEVGARLVLENDGEVPEQFVLLLTPRGHPRRECRVIWRDGVTLGVEFPPSEDPAAA